eukprot:272743-Pyramimonas_sp.AAC.1
MQRQSRPILSYAEHMIFLLQSITASPAVWKCQATVRRECCSGYKNRPPGLAGSAGMLARTIVERPSVLRSKTPRCREASSLCCTDDGMWSRGRHQVVPTAER